MSSPNPDPLVVQARPSASRTRRRHPSNNIAVAPVRGSKRTPAPDMRGFSPPPTSSSPRALRSRSQRQASNRQVSDLVVLSQIGARSSAYEQVLKSLGVDRQRVALGGVLFARRSGVPTGCGLTFRVRSCLPCSISAPPSVAQGCRFRPRTGCRIHSRRRTGGGRRSRPARCEDSPCSDFPPSP